MAGEISQEQPDEIKKLVSIVMYKITAGEVSKELIALYQNMKPENFGFWLHGFYCGLERHKELASSELFQSLKQISEEN